MKKFSNRYLSGEKPFCDKTKWYLPFVNTVGLDVGDANLFISKYRSGVALGEDTPNGPNNNQDKWKLESLSWKVNKKYKHQQNTKKCMV